MGQNNKHISSYVFSGITLVADMKGYELDLIDLESRAHGQLSRTCITNSGEY
jgi:hypothetical protein